MTLPVAVLAGGLATRLRPITSSLPKALLDVNGEPFINYQLRLLRRNQIKHVVLCVGYLGSQIQDHVGSGEQFDLAVDYSFDGPAALGTAGAIKKAIPLLGKKFFVVYGDAYLDCDYQEIARASEAKTALMTVFHNSGRWGTSNVWFRDGRILDHNKHSPTPQMQHLDYGVGVFRSVVFDRFKEEDLSSVYQNLLRDGELSALEVKNRFYEVGSFEGWRETQEMLKQCDIKEKQRWQLIPRQR